MKTLLADLNHSLDHTLWNVVRGIEERLLLLRELERRALTGGDREALLDYQRQISEATGRHAELRRLLLNSAQLAYRDLHRSAAEE